MFEKTEQLRLFPQKAPRSVDRKVSLRKAIASKSALLLISFPYVAVAEAIEVSSRGI